MDAIIDNFFNIEIILKVGPYMLMGLLGTILLSLLVVPLGAAGGLAVALIGRARRRWVRVLVIVYVDFFRAFPPLVLLLFIYFGLPFAGIDVPAVVAVAFGLFLNSSSYYGEIFRAGVESVGSGQWEAARSTGLNWRQATTYVIVPQAVRNVLPDLVSNTLEVVKLTTLASVVAIPELLHAARNAQALTYNPTPIVLAALMYLVLLLPVVRIMARLENRHMARR